MPSRAWIRLAVAGLRALPQNALSRIAGRVARVRLPPSLQRAQIRVFGALFGVDFDEARHPVESFTCFQDFFTRELRSGARPLDPSPDAFVAPCDGFWGTAGRVEKGTVLQVKGRPYSLASLLGSAAEAERFEGGAFATFYLSPRDYHRFHAPCAAQVVSARYLPGRLWPVNRVGLEGVDGLFAANERICVRMQLESDAAAGRAGGLVLVPVGATMVGSVRVTFDDLTTNLAGGKRTQRDYRNRPVRLQKGEEWGRFELGSSIVLVAEAGVLKLWEQPPGTPLQLGARIGTLIGVA